MDNPREFFLLAVQAKYLQSNDIDLRVNLERLSVVLNDTERVHLVGWERWIIVEVLSGREIGIL